MMFSLQASFTWLLQHGWQSKLVAALVAMMPIISSAQHQVRVRLFVVEGTASKEEVNAMVRMAKRQFRSEVNVRLSFDRPTFLKEYTNNGVDYVDAGRAFKETRSALRRVKGFTKGRITHVLRPLFGCYSLGLAAYDCGLRLDREALSFSTYANVNCDGQDRRMASYVAFAHELGHMVGALHEIYQPRPGIMHENAAAYAHLGLKFSKDSRVEIKQCLRMRPQY